MGAKGERIKSGPGKKRELGCSSYYENEESGETRLIYTSIESDGSVNRYTDNGEYEFAYLRYKRTIQLLENEFVATTNYHTNINVKETNCISGVDEEELG